LTISGGRVIGGNNAFSGQFPFVAAIQITTSDGRYFCGGTLISDDWILTAGQCVDGCVLSWCKNISFDRIFQSYPLHHSIGVNKLVENGWQPCDSSLI
jgi:hypothetical protein